jgi:hypothetical protein
MRHNRYLLVFYDTPPWRQAVIAVKIKLLSSSETPTDNDRFCIIGSKPWPVMAKTE